MTTEIVAALRTALISSLVSAAVSGLGVYYLHKYLDSKHAENEEKARLRREQRQKADILESRLWRASGRLFFWLHDAVIKGPEHANGDLESAFADYNKAEEEKKAFEQELLAQKQDENRNM